MSPKSLAFMAAIIAIFVVWIMLFTAPADAAHKRNGDYIGRVDGDASRFFGVRRFAAEGGIYSLWVTTAGGRHLTRGYNLSLSPRGFRVINRRSTRVKVYIQTYADASRWGPFD